MSIEYDYEVEPCTGLVTEQHFEANSRRAGVLWKRARDPECSGYLVVIEDGVDVITNRIDPKLSYYALGECACDGSLRISVSVIVSNNGEDRFSVPSVVNV